MKAVMLAGGEGTRLRPISAECPKPMVRLFDKPVMEYGVELLRKYGFTIISVTLQTMPQKITDYFGDGSQLGVLMRYSIEHEPLGTAGGVRAALEGSLDETVIVLSGDAVTDFDLRAALEFHNEKKADATLVLTRRSNVLEYGLVMTDDYGRITRFIEKPSWGQVFTDTVNTGIYILSPSALQRIPDDMAFDFARDLFPLMLDEGLNLCGYIAEGYWCDIGDSDAFLQCCRDVLDGRVRIELPEQMPPPKGVSVAQPCYIGAGVSFGANTRVGPYTVIGSGSRLDDGVSVEHCVLDGAVLEARSVCVGAYVGRGAVLREGAIVNEGAIVGEGAVIGAGAEVMESSRIWPRKEIQSGSRVSGSVSKGAVRRGAVFDGGGTVKGLPHVDLTPDFCMKLGLAAAQTAQSEVALSWKGGEAARLAALALETGICAGGARAVRTDALTPACAAFAGKAYSIPLSIFIKQDGRLLTLYFYDRDGVTPDRAAERKLEALVLRGDIMLADPQSIRPARSVSGLSELYASTAATPPHWAVAGFAPIALTVGGSGPDADILRRTLAAAGCVSGNKQGGAPTLISDGLSLSVVWENGRRASPERCLAMLIHVEAACGAERLALPCDAPAFLDDIAARLGVRTLRPERDGEAARALLADQPYMRDPVYMAARLAHGCRKLKTTLPALDKQLPDFHLTSGEVAIDADRGAVMRELARQLPGADLYEGIRTRARGGWVRVAPMPNRHALRIVAEGMSEELASELCVEFMQKVRTADMGKK